MALGPACSCITASSRGPDFSKWRRSHHRRNIVGISGSLSQLVGEIALVRIENFDFKNKFFFTYVAIRDWYYTTQSARPEVINEPDEDFPNHTIIEEDSGEEQDDETPVPGKERNKSKATIDRKPDGQSQLQSDATAELRIYEVLALLSCICFPVIGAWLLHTIRSQLSRPSEGLVSNYNLTIFLLASELRPLSHLIRMVQARTLYLQRTLNATTLDAKFSSPILDLSARVNELEAHISSANNSSANNPASSSTVATKITAEVRALLQPDLDALNRAVRRYEKRATLLAMQTESRIQDLEARMSDAITLAAAAERSSSTYSKARREGSTFILLDWICSIIVLPVQAVWVAVSLPARLASSVLEVVRGFFARNVKRDVKSTSMGRGSGQSERKAGGNSRTLGKGAKKAM